MKAFLAILVLLATSAAAADFKEGKVVEIHDASALAEAAVANHPALAQGSGAATTSIPSQYLRCELTVALDGTNYTAIFREDQHFKITDFNAGDAIHVRVEGKKLVVQRLDGKEMKSKIIRQEAAESADPRADFARKKIRHSHEKAHPMRWAFLHRKISHQCSS